MQRLLDRLDSNPIAVWDAMWNLVVANAAYDALMGETGNWRGLERNGIWRYLTGAGSRAVLTPREHDELVERLVVDLRLTAAKYPADRRLHELVAALREHSSHFIDLWDGALSVVPTDTGRRKIVAHPVVGEIEVDCDTLIVAGDDLRIMVYSAATGSSDAERLALAVTSETRSLAV